MNIKNFFTQYPDFFTGIHKFPGDIENVVSLEKKLKIVLPNVFKEFYTYSNGGTISYYVDISFTPQKSSYMTPNETIDLTVKAFYCIRPIHYSDDQFFRKEIRPNQYPLALEDQTELIDLNKIKVKYQDYLIFAESESSSDLWLMGIKKENFGNIYYWSLYDNEEYNPHWVASSFDSFLEQLIIYKE